MEFIYSIILSTGTTRKTLTGVKKSDTNTLDLKTADRFVTDVLNETGAFGDKKVASLGIGEAWSKNGSISTLPEVGSDTCFTGGNSLTYGCVSLTRDESRHGYISVTNGEKREETDTKAEYTIAPYGYVIATGKTVVNMFGHEHKSYLNKITSKNVKSGSVQGAKIFDSIKKAMKYLTDKEDAFFYMATNYGWMPQIERVSSLMDQVKDQTELESSNKQLIGKFSDSVLDESETANYSGFGTQKEVALCELKRLHVMNEVVARLQKSDNGLFISEFGGILYDMDENAWKAVEEVRKYGGYPYHVIRSGSMYAVLYVPEDYKETSYFAYNVKDGLIGAYVYNASEPMFSEFGDIIVKPTNGGIARTA